VSWKDRGRGAVAQPHAPGRMELRSLRILAPLAELP
jgi:hypothetical protein